MNKSYAVIISLLLLGYNLGFSQRIVCGADPPYIAPWDVPHFANNGILNEVLEISGYYSAKAEKLKKSTSIAAGGGYGFHVPVKIWITRDTDESDPATSESDALDVIELINDEYDDETTLMRLYLKCDIEYIDNTFYNQSLADEDDFEDLIDDYRDPKALNIYFVLDAYYFGISRFPWATNNLCALVATEDVSLATQADYLIHEIGHCFGLWHTHRNYREETEINMHASTKCYQESVDQTRTNGILCVSTYGELKCEINGDILCDTEASPADFRSHLTNCVYSNSSWKDKWNEEWTPEEDNHMAYTDPGCQEQFSEGQIGVMHSTIYSYFSTLIDWNDIYVWGSADNSDDIEIVSSETIEVPHVDEREHTYTINNGATVSLYAIESIQLNAGFKINTGGELTIDLGNISDCSTVTMADFGSKKSISIASTKFQADVQKVKELFKKERERKLELYSVTKALDPIELIKNECQIYPNPVTDIVRIELQDFGQVNIGIYNSFGQLQFSYDKSLDVSQQQNNFAIDLTDLNPGIYIYRIISGSNNYEGVIIKQ